jgi:hypothetical protein
MIIEDHMNAIDSGNPASREQRIRILHFLEESKKFVKRCGPESTYRNIVDIIQLFLIAELYGREVNKTTAIEGGASANWSITAEK